MGWESAEPSGSAERKSSSLGQAWEGQARPLGPSPSSCLELSRARQSVPQPGLLLLPKPWVCLENPLHPTLPLPGNSCGWMSGWEPSREEG